MGREVQAHYFCCEGVSRHEGTARPCVLVLNLGEVKGLANTQVWLLHSCPSYICYASFIPSLAHRLDSS